MFLYHILDICPKLLSFTICSSQPLFSLEISRHLSLAVDRNELAFSYLYKNVTMTLLIQEDESDLVFMAKPGTRPGGEQALLRQRKLDVSVRIERRIWFQGNDGKTLRGTEKRVCVRFEFLEFINLWRVYFLSGWIIVNSSLLRFFSSNLFFGDFALYCPIFPRELVLSEISL